MDNSEFVLGFPLIAMDEHDQPLEPNAQPPDAYGIPRWGSPYFSVDERGELVVRPGGEGGSAIVLKDIVDRVLAKGLGPPLLIRFPEIIKARLAELTGAFARAIGEYGYRGRYRGVYPIKVNQDRNVVARLVEYGRAHHFGLEAGSKPELLAALAMLEDEEALIVCNGYKDPEYIETALWGSKVGPPVILVAEKLHEVRLIIECAERSGIKPWIGARARLSSPGSGHWEASGGDRSKFGLSASDLVQAVQLLREHGLLDGFRLLHFHLGSQVSSIRAVQGGLREAAWIYANLAKLGAPLGYLDVGGGLGVDYSGSQSDSVSSTNYTLQEYANDIVFGVMEVCDQAAVEHPDIISESGRAAVAHHAVLVVDVLGASRAAGLKPPRKLPDDAEAPLRNLLDTYREVTPRGLREAYHDALAYREECLTLFRLGLLSLTHHGLAEELFWATCRKIRRMAERMKRPPEEAEELEAKLADIYYCNFSLFQSIPDAWAIDQVFPVVPIHRLDEAPSARAVLADPTCDSDGQLDRFIPAEDEKSPRRVLHLPPYTGEPYYLGIFFVGAYQEILGDLHNLFGDTNIVHVLANDSGGYQFDPLVPGDTVWDVLDYVRYQREELLARMRSNLRGAVAAGRIDGSESENLFHRYQEGLAGYTYLEHE